MSIKLASTSVVRPLTVTEPSSDVAQAYGVRLNVQPGIAGGGVIGGAFVGISAAKAFPQAPIIMTNEANNLCANNQRMLFFVAPLCRFRQCAILGAVGRSWLSLAEHSEKETSDNSILNYRIFMRSLSVTLAHRPTRHEIKRSCQVFF